MLLTLMHTSCVMRYFGFALMMLVAACDSPSPAFMGAPSTRIESGGFLFSVRIKGAEAEAIRLGPGAIPREGAVLTAAAAAIEQVSKCQIAKGTKTRPSLEGDQAIVRARLAC